jgi:hypothetical protein
VNNGKDGNGKEEAMIAGMTASEHDALQAGLRELPDTVPPRAVWDRIREQAEAEGLLQSPRRRASHQWYLGAGLAAAAAIVAITLNPLAPTAVEEPLATVPASEPTNPPVSSRLNVLRAESSQLEGELASLPAEPRVMRAGTTASIADITYRIEAIDLQLSDPETQLSAEDEEIFWRERVRLMKLLVKLRYAQAQRAAF